MPQNELAELRAARRRLQMRLATLESLAAVCRAKMAAIETRAQEIAPGAWFRPAASRKINPVFGRGELKGLALGLLREVGEPLPLRVIATRALAAKGIGAPDAVLHAETQTRLQMIFRAMDKRGVTVRVGERGETRRGLAAHR